MHPGARRSRLAAPVALLLAFALLPGARAQLLNEELPNPALRSSALLPTDSGRSADTEPARPPATIADTGLRSAGWLGNSVRLDVPRDMVTGQYTRPRFVVGLQSESMKNWVNSAGLDAEHCMLPMLRARTRSAADGDVNGTLWLYARCTFR